MEKDWLDVIGFSGPDDIMSVRVSTTTIDCTSDIYSTMYSNVGESRVYEGDQK